MAASGLTVHICHVDRTVDVDVQPLALHTQVVCAVEQFAVVYDPVCFSMSSVPFACRLCRQLVCISSPQPAAGRRMNHVGVMADFAFEMMKKLNRINDHAFTEFQLKIGELWVMFVVHVATYTNKVVDTNP